MDNNGRPNRTGFEVFPAAHNVDVRKLSLDEIQDLVLRVAKAEAIIVALREQMEHQSRAMGYGMAEGMFQRFDRLERLLQKERRKRGAK